MRVLVLSDSHRIYSRIENVVKKHAQSVDAIIHCGDSELLWDDPVMVPFVRNNGRVIEEGFDQYSLVEYYPGEAIGYLQEQLEMPVRIGVKGNCDISNYPSLVVYKQMMVVHGHNHYVKGAFFMEGTLDELVAEAKLRGCSVVFYGHTHIPYVTVRDDVLVINPGSLGRVPRLSYGTYAIVDLDDTGTLKEIHYYDADTQEVCDSVLELSPKLLEYFGYGR